MVGNNDYVEILSIDHIIFIAGLLIFGAGLIYYKEFIKEHRDTVTKTILTISVLQQFLLYGSYLFFTEFTMAESLPMHISRISTIIGIFYLISKDERLIKIIFYFGIYAWISFLYPTNIEKITHPLGFSFFVNHVITLLLPFYVMIAYEVRTEKNDRNKVYPLFLLYVFAAYVINGWVDGNYFYLADKPVFSTMPDYFYIPGMLIFSYLLFTLGEWCYIKTQNVLIANPSEDLRIHSLNNAKTKPRKIR